MNNNAWMSYEQAKLWDKFRYAGPSYRKHLFEQQEALKAVCVEPRIFTARRKKTERDMERMPDSAHAQVLGMCVAAIG